ncbi:MAG: NIPSNAP family protein [Thermoanaerobaculia bacterium]|nr:NIPSNAP family protein [Thermoanaerobaculia bacterium]
MRTYDLRPRSGAEAEARFAAALGECADLPVLGGAFRTEIGPLNRLVHLSRWADAGERDRVLGAAAPAWPPEIGDLLVEERAEVYEPLSVSPALEPADVGPIFELRTYTCHPEPLERMIEVWEAALPGRLEYGPLVFAGWSRDGELRRFIHLWPYRSLDARQRLRVEVREAGVWPPPLVAKKLGLPGFDLVRQENCLLVSTSYSPIR